MKRSTVFMATLLFTAGYTAHAAEKNQQVDPKLSDKLEIIRSKRMHIEQVLIDSEKMKKSAQEQLGRLKSLAQLQHQEKLLTEKRLDELQKYLDELQARKEDVKKRIDETQTSLRLKFSKLVHPLLYQRDQFIRGDEGEGEAHLRKQVLSSVTLSELKELESLNADLLDADDIESRIEQEKQQISSLIQDISEQESLIQFHQKLRQDLSHEKHEEHLKQLEEYSKLKGSEVEIGRLILQFQNRQKLEKDQDQKRRLPPALTLKARSLVWPLRGKLVGTYGQHRDALTGLNIFKKGIEILTINDHASVMSVMDGRVQYAGSLQGQNKVLIIEHPRSMYTIYGGLSSITKKMGDDVKASENIGTVESQSPLYFEIRVRNVAIDPMKWLQ